MPRITDQAICIRLIDWSETSQILALLTEQHGVLRGIAKGAKRFSPSSIARYSGGIELLTMGEVVAHVKPSADLANVTEWDLQEPWWHLRRNLAAHRLGLYGADLIGAMLAEHDPHPNCFAALRKMLEASRDTDTREETLLQFQWDVLRDCGYQPELASDVHNGQPLPDRGTYQFDPLQGGLTVDSTRNGWGVRQQTVRTLRSLSDGQPPTGDADALSRANKLLCVYARAILDRELPTMRFVLNGSNQ